MDTVEGGRDESCGCDESLRVTPHLALTSMRSAQAANYSNYDSLPAEINLIKRRLSRAH